MDMNVEMYISTYIWETISVYGNIYMYTQAHTHFLLAFVSLGSPNIAAILLITRENVLTL